MLLADVGFVYDKAAALGKTMKDAPVFASGVGYGSEMYAI